MEEIRIPYKAKKLTFILCILMFGVCAIGLTKMALSNDRGLILNGIVEFSTEGATIFYLCIAVVPALLVVMGILGIYFSVTSKKEVVLKETSISSPKSLYSKKIITVNFSDVTDYSIQSVQNQTYLFIFFQEGKLTIPQSLLPNKAEFKKLYDLVVKKIEAHKKMEK